MDFGASAEELGELTCTALLTAREGPGTVPWGAVIQALFSRAIDDAPAARAAALAAATMAIDDAPHDGSTTAEGPIARDRARVDKRTAKRVARAAGAFVRAAATVVLRVIGALALCQAAWGAGCCAFHFAMPPTPPA